MLRGTNGNVQHVPPTGETIRPVNDNAGATPPDPQAEQARLRRLANFSFCEGFTVGLYELEEIRKHAVGNRQLPAALQKLHHRAEALMDCGLTPSEFVRKVTCDTDW